MSEPFNYCRLAENIKKAITGSFPTQKEFASYICFSEAAVYAWTNGYRVPDTNSLCTIMRETGVTPNELFDGVL